MKKGICMLLVAALLLSLAACQVEAGQPEASALQQDMAQMLETAAAPAQTARQGGSLRERLGAPETYEPQIQPQSDKLTLVVDAAVQVPEVAGMPVAKVRPAQFSQEQVTAFFRYLCGDTPMYDLGRMGMSRKMLKANISMYRERVEESAENRQKYQPMLDFFETEYAKLPADLEQTRTDGTMREMVFSFFAPDIGRYQGLAAREKNSEEEWETGKVFSVRNDFKEMDWENENIDWGPETGASLFYNADKAVQFGHEPRYMRIVDELAIPEQAGSILAITPLEARIQVEELLKATDTGLAVNGIYLYEKIPLPHTEDEGRDIPEVDYAYIVTAGRVVNGIACRRVEVEANNHKTLDSMEPSWFYELIESEVTNDGIERFNWRAPVEITEMVTEQAELLPFSEIDEVFQRMILVKLGETAELPEVTHHAVKVDRVALELQRVTSKGAVDNGLLIPVWVFYGTYRTEYQLKEQRNKEQADQQVVMTSEDSLHLPDQPILTLNAVDGSVVDAWAGQ